MPSSIQYFRGNFGRWPIRNRIGPTTDDVNFLLASPLTLCDEGIPVWQNGELHRHVTPNVVVTTRGGCTFGQKALLAQQNGAAGIVFINDEPGLFHPSSVEAQSTQISTFMITQHDGNQLIQALNKTNEETLNGRFVPILCTQDSSRSYCEPTTSADKIYEASIQYNGTLSTAEGEAFEYVQGEFGSFLSRHETEWKIKVPKDVYCCEMEEFEDVTRDTAMLCLRGHCDFVTKAEIAEATGAGLVLVSSSNQEMSSNSTIPNFDSIPTRMGCDPQIRGRSLNVATAMISAEAYLKLTGEDINIRMNSVKSFECEEDCNEYHSDSSIDV